MARHTYSIHDRSRHLAGLTRPGDSIRERRIELSWTQAELAEHAGVTQADISRIENGRLNARWSTIHRLSSALEAPGTKPKRSLDNAGRNRSGPKPTGSAWTPNGPIAPIDLIIAGRAEPSSLVSKVILEPHD